MGENFNYRQKKNYKIRQKRKVDEGKDKAVGRIDAAEEQIPKECTNMGEEKRQNRKQKIMPRVLGLRW